jgi:hypothetical protein
MTGGRLLTNDSVEVLDLARRERDADPVAVPGDDDPEGDEVRFRLLLIVIAVRRI